MSKLLYIQASPRKTQSSSIAVADAFVDAYRQHQPGDDVVRLNLFERQMPTFDGNTLQAKYAILRGQNPSNEQKAEWRVIEEIIAEFTSADKYVFAVQPGQQKPWIVLQVSVGFVPMQAMDTFFYRPDRSYLPSFFSLHSDNPIFFHSLPGCHEQKIL